MTYKLVVLQAGIGGTLSGECGRKREAKEAGRLSFSTKAVCNQKLSQTLDAGSEGSGSQESNITNHLSSPGHLPLVAAQ